MKRTVLDPLFPAAILLSVIVLTGCPSTPSQPASVLPETGTSTVASVVPGLVPEAFVPPFESIAMLVSLGDPQAAIAAFEAAYQTAPEDPETQILYSNLLALGGYLPEARETLDQILEADPENVDALFSLSVVSALQDDPEGQRALLEQVVEEDPEHALALASLGEFELKDRNYDEAADLFNRSLEAEPENLAALMGLGNTRLRQGDYEAAETQFDAAAQVDPENPFVYADRSRSRIGANDYPGAVEDLNRAIELDPDYYWNLIDRGRLQLIQGEQRNALADFERAIELDPDYWYAYVFRGGLLDDLGYYQSALEDYERVYALRPDYYFVFGSMGVLNFMFENYTQSRDFLIRAFEADRTELAYPLLIALTYKKENNQAEAVRFLQDNINVFPRDSLYYEMARFYIDNNRDLYIVNLVNREADQALKTRMLFYLAAQYQINGRQSAALAYYQQIDDNAIQFPMEYRIAHAALVRAANGE